jgi:hypothetical protein
VSYLLPHHIFIVAAIDQRVDLTVVVSPKEDAALNPSPEEQIARLGH